MIEVLAIMFMLPFALIGLFVLVKTLFMPMKPPADKSNRIAHLRLVWWAITRPEMFIAQAPWLARDEQENVK